MRGTGARLAVGLEGRQVANVLPGGQLCFRSGWRRIVRRMFALGRVIFARTAKETGSRPAFVIRRDGRNSIGQVLVEAGQPRARSTCLGQSVNVRSRGLRFMRLPPREASKLVQRDERGQPTHNLGQLLSLLDTQAANYRALGSGTRACVEVCCQQMRQFRSQAVHGTMNRRVLPTPRTVSRRSSLGRSRCNTFTLQHYSGLRGNRLLAGDPNSTGPAVLPPQGRDDMGDS